MMRLGSFTRLGSKGSVKRAPSRITKILFRELSLRPMMK